MRSLPPNRNQLRVATSGTFAILVTFAQNAFILQAILEGTWRQDGGEGLVEYLRNKRDSAKGAEKLKWASKKRSSESAVLVLAGIAYVAVATLVVSVVLILTISGHARAAVRRKSRRKNEVSNKPMLADRYVRRAAGALPTVRTNVTLSSGLYKSSSRVPFHLG